MNEAELAALREVATEAAKKQPVAGSCLTGHSGCSCVDYAIKREKFRVEVTPEVVLKLLDALSDASRKIEG